MNTSQTSRVENNSIKGKNTTSTNLIFLSLEPLKEKASLMSQMVKNLPAVQETPVQSLGWKNPLEKEMTIHSSVLAWRITWTREPGGLQSMELPRVGHDCVTNTFNFKLFLEKRLYYLSLKITKLVSYERINMYQLKIKQHRICLAVNL